MAAGQAVVVRLFHARSLFSCLVFRRNLLPFLARARFFCSQAQRGRSKQRPYRFQLKRHGRLAVSRVIWYNGDYRRFVIVSGFLFKKEQFPYGRREADTVPG